MNTETIEFGNFRATFKYEYMDTEIRIYHDDKIISISNYCFNIPKANKVELKKMLKDKGLKVDNEGIFIKYI